MDPVAELRNKVIMELERLNPLETDHSKVAYRDVHTAAVQLELERNRAWVQQHYPKYAHYFANGGDVNPSQIAPALVEVVEDWHSDLFRLARLTWALPYTRGYGRRLRFLVMPVITPQMATSVFLERPSRLPVSWVASSLIFS